MSLPSLLGVRDMSLSLHTLCGGSQCTGVRERGHGQLLLEDSKEKERWMLYYTGNKELSNSEQPEVNYGFLLVRGMTDSVTA